MPTFSDQPRFPAHSPPPSSATAAWLAAAALLLLFGPRPVAGDEPASPVAPQSRPRPQLMVVCIGGVDSDPTPEQIALTAPRHLGNSGLFRLAGDLRNAGLQAEYFNWNGTRAGRINDPRPPMAAGIVRFLRDHAQRHPGDPLALVGNSWGGHTTLEVLRLLYSHPTPLAIDLVVFLDASSMVRGPGKPKSLPANANRVINYFTRHWIMWGPLPGSRRFANIDLGDPDAGYMSARGPAYDSRFDFRGHIAAEWDERIHAEITRALVDLRLAVR